MIQYSSSAVGGKEIGPCPGVPGRVAIAFVTLFLFAARMSFAAGNSDGTTISTDAISNTPIAQTWELLTTKDGYRKLGLNADVDLRLGGTLTVTDPAAGAQTRTSDILAYEPERMLALAGRSETVSTHLWTVIYLTPLGADMTDVRIVRLGFDNTTPPQLRAALAEADRRLLDRLVAFNHPKCALCAVPQK
jgi:hypothetical protein